MKKITKEFTILEIKMVYLMNFGASAFAYPVPSGFMGGVY